jgi:hypothetical protein
VSGKGDGDSAATVLVRLALSRYDFGIADSGEAFAVPKNGPRTAQMLRGGKPSLRTQLSRMYFDGTGKAAPSQALADALLVLQGGAEMKDEDELHQRVAKHDGALWLDLGDQAGRAIRIQDGTWTVEDESPVLFRRTVLNSPLPEPVRGGDLEDLWTWLNVTKEDRPLVAAWLVALLHPSIPHPVLGLFGEQGTGKTTAEKVLVSILDPSPVPTRKPPKDAEAWITAASGSWVVGLDNLSVIPDWLSDSICRAVTGDGDVRRQLYADNALVVFAFRRCIVMTGIDLGALNGDLAERLLGVLLEVIDPSNRIEENDLWPRWAKAHPRILGAVLDLAAQVSELLPGIVLDQKPRMADFARIVRAVDEVLGTDGLDRYMEAQSSMATDALTGDQFVITMHAAISRKIGMSFTGSAKDVLDLVALTDERWRPPKGWPTNARAVTSKLRRQAPVMRKAGWSVTDDGSANRGKSARWTIAIPGAPAAYVDPQMEAFESNLLTGNPHLLTGNPQAAGYNPRLPAGNPQGENSLTTENGAICGSAGHAGLKSGHLHCGVGTDRGSRGSEVPVAICADFDKGEREGPLKEIARNPDPRDPQIRTKASPAPSSSGFSEHVWPAGWDEQEPEDEAA